MKKAPTPSLDPTLPTTDLELLGKTYKLCLNFRAMAAADAWLRREGVVSDILRMLPALTFETIPVVLAASLHTFHPELTFEDVVALVDYDTVWDARDKIYDAWAQAYPKRTAEEQAKAAANPPQPVLN